MQHSLRNSSEFLSLTLNVRGAQKPTTGKQALLCMRSGSRARFSRMTGHTLRAGGDVPSEIAGSVSGGAFQGLFIADSLSALCRQIFFLLSADRFCFCSKCLSVGSA